MKDELKDQLRKLGLRVRPRTVDKTERQQETGTVNHDVRGNAVFEWGSDALAEDSESGERARNKALTYHGLSLVDDEPAQNAPIQQNPKGTRVGYNPYESGMLSKQEPRKRTNLRELSKWVEQKRKVQQKKDE